MNRKSSVCWLRPLLGTASTSLLVWSLSVPAQAAEISPIESPEPAIAVSESQEVFEVFETPAADSIAASLPKSSDLGAIETKAIPASVLPISTPPPAASPNAARDVAVSEAEIPEIPEIPASVELSTSISSELPADNGAIAPDSSEIAELPADDGAIAPLIESPDAAIVAQRSSEPEPTSQQAIDLVGEPLVRVQGAIVLQNDETSARARLTAEYAISPNVLIGTTIDLTTGNAFVDSESEGFNINELYVAASPEGLPGLRFVAGMVDLTSYFDRNSFAKDGVTHFFNPVFQTNPALAVTGIGSRPSALVIWQVNDSIEVKAATFSSSRNLDEFAFDGFAGEVGVRLGDLIVRGTFSSDRDDGQNDGFREIFSFDRGNGDFGLDSDDREQAYGINAEWWIPNANLGLFGRYGRYENLELDRAGDTFSFGFNLLDLFMPDDRLGLAYGRQLSNNELRQAEGANLPDVLELFYDARISPNLRAGVSLQQRDAFSETVFGLRIRADFDLLGGR